VGLESFRARPAVAAAGLVLALSAAGACVDRAAAQVFLTQDEALELAFPDAEEIERRTAFLSDGDRDRAEALVGGGIGVEQGIVTYYVAARDGSPIGAAYFDVHRVRTLQEVLMVVVGTDGRVRRLEILRFAEPPDYLAPKSWLDQFYGRALDESLQLKGGIVYMTGATLTSRAITDAARRVLALHQVIQPFREGA